MLSTALRLGPLGSAVLPVRRSGIIWLREDGGMCRAGEVVAYCAIGLGRLEAMATGHFGDESHDLQAAVATPIAGRLRHGVMISRGGFLDLMDHFQTWAPDTVIGSVETAEAGPAAADVQLSIYAARRRSWLAEGRWGLSVGWHSRARAWRADGAGPWGTLLSVGACENFGVVRGDRRAFLEMLETVRGQFQVAHADPDPFPANVRFFLEQLRRTPAEREAIQEDLARGLMDASRGSPDAKDLMFSGAFLRALLEAPLAEPYPLLSRAGLAQTPPADAILLSLNAEPTTLWRHRRLGYVISLHDWRLHGAGPGMLRWLRTTFEPVRRTPADIGADYHAFIDDIAQRWAPHPPPQLLILNIMSSSGADDVQTYAGFDTPMEHVLSSMRAKGLNLMLHDLARERGVAIVDMDALVAEMGGHANMPDGIHQSGVIQAELRAEVLRILRARGVRGFAEGVDQPVS